MTSKTLVKYNSPARITEREVRIAGVTSNRLLSLRGMLSQGIREGSIAVRTTNGNQAITLPINEMEAVIALLIERDEAFLIGLDIELEKPR